MLVLGGRKKEVESLRQPWYLKFYMFSNYNYFKEMPRP
jgi:hypothetical protein